MTTPVQEIPEPSYPVHLPSTPTQPSSIPGPPPHAADSQHRSYEHDASIRRATSPPRSEHSEKADTRLDESDYIRSPLSSSSRAREQNRRLEDDLELLRAERVASRTSEKTGVDLSRSRTQRRSRSRHGVDDFDISTNPVHDNGKGVYRPPRRPATKIAKFFKMVHESSVLVRYFTYIVPVVLLLLIPLLLGALLFEEAGVGGVYLMWFMVWLQIVWLSLWAGRILAKCLPYIIGMTTSIFTNSSKKYKDMARVLEVPATLFFWWLAVFISFLPTMTNHHIDGNKSTREWERQANIVLLTLFIAMVLNFVEKIIIQLIAISFHQRTYEDRIELNKFQIQSLAKLYAHSKEKGKDLEFEDRRSSNLTSGARTPMAVFAQAKQGAQQAINKVGDVMGKVAGDFTGRKVASSTAPHQVVITLLYTTEGSQVLARRLYRSFVQEGAENVCKDDLQQAFVSEEEAEAAFVMFDRDLNGDISCEEMEIACVEIGRERKAIIASLKDLDCVVSKLDDVLTFIVVVIVVLVFLSLISRSTAGILASASSSVLALSWLFSATAQEFLASIIFVFVKHPFDVGDRVDIYNTGAGTKDTFFVKEIALMYTEFKKLEGHVVQAPNSLLNTLFILNMRRSGALAEAIPLVCKFGTTLEQIEDLRELMLAFVISEKREYQPKVLTELRDVPDMHSVKLNVVFFYKSNWQNELVRLQRRNKFMCALMVNVLELGIESPNMRWPGQKESSPVYLSTLHADQLQQSILDRQNPDLPPARYKSFIPGGAASSQHSTHSAPVAPPASPGSSTQHSILRTQSLRDDVRPRARSNSAAAAAKRVDFSLGVRDVIAQDDCGDVYNDTRNNSLPTIQLARVLEEEESDAGSVSSARGRESGPAGGEVRKRAGSGSVRQNRFFGKRRSEDLESGGSGALTPPRQERNKDVGSEERMRGV